jgi:hypothetical protein
MAYTSPKIRKRYLPHTDMVPHNYANFLVCNIISQINSFKLDPLS